MVPTIDDLFKGEDFGTFDRTLDVNFHFSYAEEPGVRADRYRHNPRTQWDTLIAPSGKFNYVIPITITELIKSCKIVIKSVNS